MYDTGRGSALALAYFAGYVPRAVRPMISLAEMSYGTERWQSGRSRRTRNAEYG